MEDKWFMYKETDIELDKLQLNTLINRLVKQNGENARFMKLFLERKKIITQSENAY